MPKTRDHATHPHAWPTAAELTVGVALACTMSWVSMNFKSLSLFASYTHSETLLDAVYLVSIIAVSLTLFTAGGLDRATGSLLERRATRFALPLGVTASTLVMPLAGLEGLAGEVALYASGVLSGVFSGLFLFEFGMAFSLMTTRSIVIGAAVGSTLSTLLFALSVLFQPLEACLFSASMPPIAAVLLANGMRGVRPAEREEPCALSDQRPLDDAQERGEWRQLTAKLALASFLVGFANEATRTLYMQMGIANNGATPYAFIQALTSFGVTAGTVAIALALLASKAEHMARNAYHALVVLLMMGTLLLPLPLLYPQIGVHLPYAVNAAGYTCFGMFMWTITASVCGRYQQARVRTFGFVRGAWALGPLLGMLLGRYVLHGAGLSLETTFPVMLAAALALLLASNGVFTGTDLVKAMDIIPLARKQRFRAKCLRVIERYGLSEREGEIMVMLAKGRNLPYVQEHLYLSRSTVSTHRQHIYQKLEIHSQQELMDLVERTEE